MKYYIAHDLAHRVIRADLKKDAADLKRKTIYRNKLIFMYILANKKTNSFDVVIRLLFFSKHS